MTTLKNFGVPQGDGSRSGIIMPWYSFRFRVMTRALGVMQNVEDVAVDFVAKTVKINVRSTVDPEHFVDALRFQSFRLDCMDGGNDKPIYSLLPQGLKLVGHNFDLAYSNSKPAMHRYVFSFEDMGVEMPQIVVAEEVQKPAPTIDDDGFMTPAEALRSLEEKKGLTNGRQLLNEVPTRPRVG